MRRMIAGSFLLVGSAGIGASPFAAVATDCDGAEVVGLIQVDGPHSSPLSFRKSGSLQPEEVTFLSFDADPDRILSVRYAGEEDAQVLLGIFDSRCQLLSWSDLDPSDMPQFEQEAVRMRFRVPDDGQFFLALTGQPDRGFIGDRFDPAFDYLLSIAEPSNPTRAIAGRVLSDGKALPGPQPPFSHVKLYSCDTGEGQCNVPIVTVIPDVDGRFELLTGSWVSVIQDHQPDGTVIETTFGGNYLIKAWAARGGYEPRIRGPFHMEVGEERVDTNFDLRPPPPNLGSIGRSVISPIEFELAFHCENLPASGGTCNYVVAIHNNSGARIHGSVWSNVDAHGLGLGLGYSSFTASRRKAVVIQSHSSTTVGFSFEVPADAADGAVLCADIWLAERQATILVPTATTELFCIQKQAHGYVVVTE